jgi:hypothetical protein
MTLSGQRFRIIDWGSDGFVTIELNVSRLTVHEREALLAKLNAQLEQIETATT